MSAILQGVGAGAVEVVAVLCGLSIVRMPYLRAPAAIMTIVFFFGGMAIQPVVAVITAVVAVIVTMAIVRTRTNSDPQASRQTDRSEDSDPGAD